MTVRLLGAALLLGLQVVPAMPVAAQKADSRGEAKAEKPEGAIPPPTVSVTRHTGTFGGQKISYTAIAGETYLKDRDGTPTAAITSYSYIKDGKDPNRPVFFLFNGGPGSGSVWLHMGAFGPKRVVIPNALDDGAPPYPLIDNAESLLDVADLVFIDPVGTGASMPVKDKDASGYWGVGGDARGVSAMIEAWVRANGRSASPRILVGESYGTARAVAILNEDAKAEKSLPDGVVLLSLAIGDADGPVLSEVTTFPTFAAVAWYHQAIDRGGRSVAQHYAEALAFAQTDYASALMRGPALPAAERRRVAERMATLIGIPAATIEAKNLRLEKYDFMLGLLAAKGLRTGQLDARATRAIAESQLRPPFDDPSMSLGSGSSAKIEAYLKDELGYAVPSAYRSLNLGINFKWNWDKDYGGSYRAMSFAPYLKTAMAAKPGMKLFAGGAYYDITTPVFAGQFALEQAGIPAERTTYGRYAAGHSVFEDEGELAKLSEDLHRFVGTVSAAK
jgi:carboxypeptidase C (cathepsin A)